MTANGKLSALDSTPLRRLLRAKDRLDAASHEHCRAMCDKIRAWGVEITQEPVERYGTLDAGFFRDPSGNGWKKIQPSKS